MKRALSIVGLAVAAGTASAALAAAGQPTLRSAALINRHVVVEFTVGELTPGVIQVALRPTKSASGNFLAANLVVSEVVGAQPDPASGVVRWRTRKALPFRRYYVQVSGIETGGVTDCKPGRRDCLVHWSNVRVVSAHGG
jgi:hypothetical protein